MGVGGASSGLDLLLLTLTYESALKTQSNRTSITLITVNCITGLRVPVSADVLVSVGDGENIDNAVKRFKREVSVYIYGCMDVCMDVRRHTSTGCCWLGWIRLG